jgi:hypothetical protein
VTQQNPNPPAQSDSSAANEISLGEIYEQQDRLTDAEKAYAKALETATGTDRQSAQAHLKTVFEKEKLLRIKYLGPSLEEASLTVWKTIVSGLEWLLLVLVIWLTTKAIRRIGEHRGRNKVQVADFIDATGESGAAAFAEQMRNALAQVQEYFRARDPLRLSSFSSLLMVSSPRPEDMVELASGIVSSPLGKLITFFTTGLFRPHYKITGMVQKTGFQYSCWVKLYHKELLFGSWERQFASKQCTELQEQLAFEVAMYLKEEVDANRD